MVTEKWLGEPAKRAASDLLDRTLSSEGSAVSDMAKRGAASAGAAAGRSLGSNASAAVAEGVAVGARGARGLRRAARAAADVGKAAARSAGTTGSSGSTGAAGAVGEAAAAVSAAKVVKIVGSAASSRGVPKLPGFKGPSRPGLALGLGLAAAGVTGAAGFAAERLSRERRQAKLLDETLGTAVFDGDPDETLTVTAPDGVQLYVEIDHPRGRPAEASTAETVEADRRDIGQQAKTPGQDRSTDKNAEAGTEQQPTQRTAVDPPEAPESVEEEWQNPSMAPDDAAAQQAPVPESERPTVVLSHGYCLSSACWIFQRRALRRAGYKVVLWDQRGHGRSGAGDSEKYNVDTLGGDLAAVIEAAAPTGPLVLVGHSMGGMTMMSYALNHPEEMRARTVGAAFVATSANSLQDIDIGLGKVGSDLVNRVAPGLARRLAGVPRLVSKSVDLTRDVVDYLVNWGSFGSPVPMSVAKLTTDMITGTDLDVVAAFMPGFADHSKLEALQQFEGRELLVFNGTKDRLTPPSYSDEIVRHLPTAEHVLVEGAGHVIMLEVPVLLNESILDLVHRAERAGDTTAEQAGVARTRPRLQSVRRARRHHIEDIQADYESTWK